jgi:4-hydroxy-tetrahydrodipicolinate synthase
MDYRRAEAKEAARAQFRGVWAAINTPFTPDGDLDESGLRHNVRRLTDALRIDGVFCTGVMGEFWSLTLDEWRRCIEIVVEEARGKCRVIAHTGHHSVRQTVALTRYAQEVGADYAIVINPYYPPASEQGLYTWFHEVAAQVDIGLWLFDTMYAGYRLSPVLIARVAEIENVCGIKLAWPMDHYLAVKAAVGDRIVVSHPSEANWLMLMRNHGQRVHMSSPVPYLYQVPGYLPMRDYTELGLTGRFEEAAAIAETLAPLRALHEQWIGRKWQEARIMPIAYIKAWAELLGLAGGPVRPPLEQVTEAERAALRADLERVGLLGRVSAPA